jgi:hypothetical protein
MQSKQISSKKRWNATFRLRQGCDGQTGRVSGGENLGRVGKPYGIGISVIPSIAKSSQQAGITSMHAQATSRPKPGILHFVQNDKAGLRTRPKTRREVAFHLAAKLRKD